MQADERAFLEDMLETAERLDWVTCQEETRHTQEAVGSITGGVTELAAPARSAGRGLAGCQRLNRVPSALEQVKGPRWRKA
jgi:hypothetical protein